VRNAKIEEIIPIFKGNTVICGYQITYANNKPANTGLT